MTRIKTVFIHIGLWAIYWGLEITALLASDENFPILEALMNLTYNTLYFYATLYFVFPRDTIKVNPIHLSLRFLLLLSTAIIIKWLYTNILNHWNPISLFELSNVKFFIWANIYRLVIFTIYAGFIWFFTTRMKMQKYVMDQEIEQQKLKNDLLTAQFDTLKAQINPHFLFNTLSFIYSKAVSSSDEVVSNSILLLSDVLRYSLQQTKEGDRVRLNNEIGYIRKLYEINRLRFGGRCYIDIQSRGEEHHQKIPPLILLTLFENAMKHGDFQDPEHPIRIEIHQYADKVEICVQNKKQAKPDPNRQDGFKIGNKYIVQVLDNFHKDNYNLEIDDQEHIFMEKITIRTHD